MKRSISVSFDTASARNATPSQEANIVTTPVIPEKMPVDLLDGDDLARFTRIRVMDFDDANSSEEFGPGVPFPFQDFVSFVTSRKIPTNKSAVWTLMEYVLSEFPTLALTLFQTAKPTDLSLLHTDENIYLNLMDTLDRFPGLKKLNSSDNVIELDLLLEFIARDNSVVQLCYEDALAEGVDGEEIIRAFSKNSKLEFLSLGPVHDLDVDQMDCVGRALVHHPTLTYFELLLERNLPEDEVTHAIVTIITQNDRLKTLVMDVGCTSDSNIEKIANAIKLNNTIQHLDCKIQFDNLSKKALTAIRDALQVNETLLNLTDTADSTFDAFMEEEIDAEQNALFGSITALLKRNARFLLPETIDYATGACAGFVTQLGMPPELGSVLEKFLTMQERLALTGITTVVPAVALTYQLVGQDQRLANEDSTGSDTE